MIQDDHFAMWQYVCRVNKRLLALTDIGKFPTLFAHISYSKFVFHGDNMASA